MTHKVLVWENGYQIERDATPEESAEIEARAMAPKSREALKQERSEIVSRIKVTTTAGNCFDGDEESQGRMARAIVGMDDGDSILWVLADNSGIQASRDELREALRLAGAAQAAVWVLP